MYVCGEERPLHIYICVCIIEYSTLTVIVSEKGRKSQQEDEARDNKTGSETSPNLGTVEIDRRKNRGGCNIYETGMGERVY